MSKLYKIYVLYRFISFYSVLIPNQQKTKKKQKSWDQPYLSNLSKTQASPGKKHWSTVLEAALGPKAALESQSSAQFAWSNLEESIPQLLSWSCEGERAVYRLFAAWLFWPFWKTGHPWMKHQTAESKRHQTGPSKAVSHSNPRKAASYRQSPNQSKSWY